MKKILSILILSITLTSSAQYNILSAVQLNEGQEEQYLALEAFFGPIHELAIEYFLASSGDTHFSLGSVSH